MTEKLQLAMKAHAIGVEDAKAAMGHMVSLVPLAEEVRAEVLKAIAGLVILPTRILKEIPDVV